MNDEKVWTSYADENLAVSMLCADSGYYNASLQNAQQAVEKYFKAVLLRNGQPAHRTHSISALRSQLSSAGIDPGISEEDCELLDTIYIPSKYPLGGALPDFTPNETICRQVLAIALRVKDALAP